MTQANFTTALPTGPGIRGSSLMGLIHLVRDRSSLLALTILSGILTHSGALASMGLGAWLVGRAATGADPHSLIPGFCWLGASAVLAAAARWWQAYVSHDFAFALIETLQVGIYDGLERAAPGYVQGRRTGELASVATGDAELMEFFYAHTMADYVAATVVPLGALGVLLAVHPLVALAFLPFPLLVASVPYWLARRAGEQGRAVLTQMGQLNAETVELIQGQRELAIFGRARDALARLMDSTRALAALQRRYGSRAGLEQAAIDVLTAFAVLTVALVGAMLVQDGRLDRALFPLVIVLTGGALMPIVEVTQTARKLGELRAGAARVLDIFHLRSAVSDQGRAARPADATVRFEKVGFSYADGGHGAVLQGIDLSISQGETVALVGRSGAGKSTCANLLLRFWDVGTGTSASEGRMCAICPWLPFASWSPMSRRSPIYSMRPWPTTSGSDGRTHRRTTWSALRGWPRHTTSSAPCPMVTSLAAVSAAPACPAGSASASLSRGPCWWTHPSCCWTKPRPAWTPKANAPCNRPWMRSGATGPYLSSPTGSRPSERPTASWCWMAAASWSKASTQTCWPWVAPMPPWWRRRRPPNDPQRRA